MVRGNSASLPYVVFNGLLFNVSWLAIVYTHSSVLAVCVASAHLLVHFLFMGRGWPEAKLVLAVSLLGFILDQLIFAAGILGATYTHALAPFWISCLWPVFATTLMHAFSSLQNRLVLAAVIGSVGGTASYLAGASLSDVQFVSPLWGPAGMSVVWSGLFPLLLLGARLMSRQSD